MTKSTIHAYMSGALTNLKASLQIPPCAEVGEAVRQRYERAKQEVSEADLKLVEAAQKKHYERVKEQVCRSLGVDLYLPHQHSDPEHNADLVAETVYYVDRLRVTSSRFVIACLDVPSLGVGQEIEIATQTGIPVIAYKHLRTKASRMPLGSPILCEDMGRGLSADEDCGKVIEYENEPELFPNLTRRISFLLQYLASAVPPRRAPETFADLLRRLIEQDGGMNNRVLAKRLGVPATYTSFLQKNEFELQRHFSGAMPSMVQKLREISVRYDFDRFPNPSLTVLRQLAYALNLTVAELIGESQGLGERLDHILGLCRDHHNASLDEFAYVARSVPPSLAFSKLDEYVAKKIKEYRRQ